MAGTDQTSLAHQPGGAGADTLGDRDGGDLFRIGRGEAQGDLIRDFSGAGGDLLELSGYGGGSIALVSGNLFRVTGGDGFSETLTIVGAFDPATNVVFIG